MRILVAGAGIAGLTFAALMKQRGRDVELIDRAAIPADDNYPIILAPIGTRVLHGFGVMRRFRAVSPELDILRVADLSGHSVSELDMRPLLGPEERLRVTERATLLKFLASLAGDMPIAQSAVTAIASEGEKVIVRIGEGDTQRYDLVVGADGVDSAVRQLWMPGTSGFKTGWTCCLFPAADGESGRALEYWGSGRMLGIYPGAWQMHGMICAPRRKLSQDRKVRAQKYFRRIEGAAKNAIAEFPDDSVPLLQHALQDRRAAQWVKDRVCLLGDAACSFLPTAPMGASFAMEAASVLADELSRAGSRTVPQALSFYEKRMRKRIESAQNESRKSAKRLFTRNPLAAMMHGPSPRLADYQTIARLTATTV